MEVVISVMLFATILNTFSYPLLKLSKVTNEYKILNADISDVHLTCKIAVTARGGLRSATVVSTCAGHYAESTRGRATVSRKADNFVDKLNIIL